MSGKPKYLQAKMRTKDEVVEWLKDTFAWRGGSSYSVRTPHGGWIDGKWGCWNVKAHSVDMSFINLKVRMGETGEQDLMNDSIFMEAACELFGDYEHHLWEWGVEGARRNFVGDSNEGIPDDEAYSTNYEGESMDVRYSFGGRSGGWLFPCYWQGFVLEHGFWDEMNYAQLQKYYRFIWEINYFVRNMNVARVIEQEAAYTFFMNVCRDCPRTEVWYPPVVPMRRLRLIEL